MNTEELISKYSPLLKRYILPLSLGALGMIFFIYGLIGLFWDNKPASEDVVFESSSGEKESTEAKTILVDIEGAVVRPGVYSLSLDARIQDALVSAGGLSSVADREFVSKRLNLATKLTDGAKIYIPLEGEAESIPTSLGLRGASAGSTELTSTSGQININSASQSQLEALPGIGPVTAQKIIGGRPYGSVDELLNKKIVGSKVFSQIKDKVSIY